MRSEVKPPARRVETAPKDQMFYLLIDAYLAKQSYSGSDDLSVRT